MENVLNVCDYTLTPDANAGGCTNHAVAAHSLSNRKGHVGQVLGSQEFSELFLVLVLLLLLLLLSFSSHG